MITEDLYGGFGKENEKIVREWCSKHANEYENSTELAEACANVFDFYLDDNQRKIPERLFEIALEKFEESVGEAFGSYMGSILNDERAKRKQKNAPVQNESYGQIRARRTQELPQNRIIVGKKV